MMGVNHAATGAAAAVAVFGTTSFSLGWMPLSPTGVVIASLVTAGAAILPDCDEPDATAAWTLPPLSNLLASGINVISGGHRHGTHSLVFIVFATVLTWLAGFWDLHLNTDVGPLHIGTVDIGSALIAGVMIAFAAKALKLTRRQRYAGPWILAVLVTAIVALWSPGEFTWLSAAVGLGVFVHVLGDSLTEGGVPWLWPFHPAPPRRLAGNRVVRAWWAPNGFMTTFGAPLGRTGAPVEYWVTAPLAIYAIVGVGFAGYMAVASLDPAEVADAGYELVRSLLRSG